MTLAFFWPGRFVASGFVAAAVVVLGGCGVIGGYARSGLTVPYSFFWVANYGSTSLTGFYLKDDGTIVPSTGVLPTGTGTASPASAVIDPTGARLYAGMFNSANIAAYSIAPLSAAYPSVLSPLTSSNLTPAGAGTQALAMASNGKNLYSVSFNLLSNNVITYAIGSTGALTALGTVSAKTNPISIVLTPNGKFAYVVNQGVQNISEFTVSATDGTLAPIGGGLINSGVGPTQAVVDPTGAILICVNNGANTLGTYFIDPSSGLLTAASSVVTGVSPTRMAMHPSGFVYVSNATDNTVSGFRLNATTGVLTALPGSPYSFTGETSPFAVTVDPTGAYLLTTWVTSGDVSAFAIGTTGALTAVGVGQPSGNLPESIVAARYSEVE